MGTAMNVDAVQWNDDGHRMWLELNRSEVRVIAVDCPGGDEIKCLSPEHGCLVKHFVLRYGLECNVGTCSPSESMQVAWTFIGSLYDIDAGQVWVMPIDDPIWGAWASGQRGE